MMTYLDMICIGDIRTSYIDSLLADGMPVQLIREAMKKGLPLKIELYRTEMNFGDKERYGELIEESVQALTALFNEEEVFYRGRTIPAK